MERGSRWKVNGRQCRLGWKMREKIQIDVSFKKWNKDVE